MECKQVRATREQMLEPLGAVWEGGAGETLKLDATPLANQPSEYIKASRDAKQIGKVRSLAVQAAHNGQDVFFRLVWEDEGADRAFTDTNVFVDGCGVLMPIKAEDTPIDEMGSKDVPVNAWFWRADREDQAQNTFAKGLGTTEFSKECAVQTKSVWENGRWTVVFARALVVPGQPEESVQLAVGGTVKVGFAVWEGSNQERAGLKSFSKEWRELVLEA